MTDAGKTLKNRYCLRYAGGVYWLLDCEQEGVPYKEPIPMNEVGADIWSLMEQGKTESEIVEQISEDYGADKETVKQDVEQFRKQLLKMTGEIDE